MFNVECLIIVVFFGVVGLGGLSLNHYGGVAMLVKLRLIGDRPHHITGGQSQSRCQRRQCGDESHDDGFDDFLLCH